MKGGKPRQADTTATLETPEHLQPGLVISHLGKGLAVETEDGRILLCHTRSKRLGEAAVGDRVLWSPCDGEQGRV